MSGKLKKPLGVESKDIHEFKLRHQPYYSPSLLGASCLEVSGGNHWKSCGEKECPEKRLLFLLDKHGRGSGRFNGAR